MTELTTLLKLHRQEIVRPHITEVLAAKKAKPEHKHDAKRAAEVLRTVAKVRDIYCD